MKLTTGQVSKLFDISKDTLRHYHKLGLLNPEVDNTNGYRYYTQAHIDQLNLILATKDLDISLSDIKEVIKSEDEYEYKKLVLKQEKLIKEKIESLRRTQKQLSKWNYILDTIINFKNEYNFENIEPYKGNYNLFGMEFNELLKIENSKEYIKYLDENLEYMDEECYYSIYNITDIDNVEENNSSLFIMEDEKNKDIIRKYINKGLNIIQKNLSGNFISVKFYGNSNELEGYLALLNKYFNEGKENEVFIRCDYYIPRKNDNEKYFVEILLNVK